MSVTNWFTTSAHVIRPSFLENTSFLTSTTPATCDSLSQDKFYFKKSLSKPCKF
jgi:hypothetical protein